jgi:IS4 transposase
VREIRVRIESGKILRILSNDIDASADEIAALYKRRWQIELFFRWIKQNLRIKSFFGYSENAVRTQIWIAVTVYVLVALIKKRLRLDASLYTILQSLSVTLFEKMTLDQLLMNLPRTHEDHLDSNQLKLLLN